MEGGQVMLRRYLGSAVVFVVLAGALKVYGQEASEMYIPIGESPGLSNKLSLIGTLESVDAGAKIVHVSNPSGAQSVTLTERTRIWLDRSLDKQPNRSGAAADLQRGRKVEIKLRRGEPGPVADWIKVQDAGVK
jgi:hypothetical protein